jgi:hypothetical protein
MESGLGVRVKEREMLLRVEAASASRTVRLGKRWSPPRRASRAHMLGYHEHGFLSRTSLFDTNRSAKQALLDRLPQPVARRSLIQSEHHTTITTPLPGLNGAPEPWIPTHPKASSIGKRKAHPLSFLHSHVSFASAEQILFAKTLFLSANRIPCWDTLINISTHRSY